MEKPRPLPVFIFASDWNLSRDSSSKHSQNQKPNASVAGAWGRAPSLCGQRKSWILPFLVLVLWAQRLQGLLKVCFSQCGVHQQSQKVAKAGLIFSFLRRGAKAWQGSQLPSRQRLEAGPSWGLSQCDFTASLCNFLFKLNIFFPSESLKKNKSSYLNVTCDFFFLFPGGI